jgi:hypothetical protein
MFTLQILSGFVSNYSYQHLLSIKIATIKKDLLFWYKVPGHAGILYEQLTCTRGLDLAPTKYWVVSPKNKKLMFFITNAQHCGGWL